MWLFLSLLAPFVFALTQFIDKYLIDKRIRDPWLITVLGGFGSILVAGGIILLHGFQLISIMQIALLLGAGASLTYYLIPYFGALASDDTSNVTPLFQFVAPITLIFAFIFLKEQLTRQQLFAFGLLFAGGIFLASQTGTAKGIFTLRKSFWLMIAASIIATISGILFKMVSNQIDFVTTMIYVNIGAAIASFSLIFKPSLRKGFIKQVRKLSIGVWFLIFIDEGLNISAEMILLLAVSLAPVSLVNAIGGIQPLYIILIAVFLSIVFPKVIKEDLGKGTLLRKVISIAMICIGVYLLYI